MIFKRLCCALIIVIVIIMDAKGRKVSDEERKLRANLIRQLLKKYQKEEGHIRLVGGKDKNEGNVEVLHNNKWGAICDDEWGNEEAEVICKQLNFQGYVKHTHSAEFGLATRKFWMDNLYCSGKEDSISKCRFDGWGTSDCLPEEAAGVVCKTNVTTPLPIVLPKPKKPKKKISETFKDQPFNIRLSGGRLNGEGRVEVKYGDKWGTICGDGWSILEAMVVCKSLGLGYASNAYQTDYFGGNISSIVLSGVKCNSSEDTLDHCFHDEVGDVDCPGIKTNLAAVGCTTKMADLLFDHYELMRTAHLEDVSMVSLTCAMEENCLASYAYVMKKERSDWFTETRRLLRFTASTMNIGTADFRPAVPKHMWEWHMCHMHYHSMEVFAAFDIIDHEGRRVAEGHKASFCLEDNTCQQGIEPKYACENYGDQGVSVNCSDVYKYNIDCQWIDISELAPGDYRMRVAVNPEMKVPEMSYQNNAASCKLLYTETFATVYDCHLHMP